MSSDWLEKLKNRRPGILGSEQSAKYAVLVPLLEKEGKLQVLFEVRALTLKHQPGEICFPGGRIEKDDKHPLQGALREAKEELNLAEADIEYLAPLDVLVTSMNSIIYPYLARITQPAKIQPSLAEVDRVFSVPLDYLYAYEPLLHTFQAKFIFSDDFPFELIPNGKDYNWRTGTHYEYFYFYQEHIIWGMTARIVKHFLDLTREEYPHN